MKECDKLSMRDSNYSKEGKRVCLRGSFCMDVWPFKKKTRSN